MAFHVSAGWMFDRREDGAVELWNEQHPELGRLTMEENSWASVIATMSAWGEENEGHARALDFHRQKPI